MSSSSSDFSSDEGEMAYAPDEESVQIEVVEDEDAPTDPRDAAIEDPTDGVPSLAELLVRVRGALSAEAIAAVESLVAHDEASPAFYAYETYTTALYYLSATWPEAPGAQRDVHCLRAAIYARFQELFPLTPEMYMEWIADAETIPEKLRLFGAAKRDYWSVTLAVLHLQFLQEHKDMDPGITWVELEATMEEMLATVGYHYAQGHEVWRLCRELVTEHYDSDEDADGDLAKEAAIRELYCRQLSIPLQQNDLVMSEFRAWNEYNILETEARRTEAFRTAERCHKDVFGPFAKKMNQYEERLVAATTGTGAETLDDAWLSYLKFACFRIEPKFSDSAHGRAFVCCMFERAVSASCLSSELWSEYFEAFNRWMPKVYHNVCQELVEQKIAVCHRAVRNISNDSSAWIELLLALDTRGTRDDVRFILQNNKLLTRGVPVMDSTHFVLVLITYSGVISRTRRIGHIDYAFSESKSLLQRVYPSAQQALSRLLEFHAQCYLNLAQDVRIESSVPGARSRWKETWEQIFLFRGHEAECWLKFFEEYRFAFSRVHSFVEDVRHNVFVPAVKQVRDFPLLIFEKWLMFEMTVGGLQEIAQIRTRMHKLARKNAGGNAQAGNAPNSTPSDESRHQERSQKRSLEETSTSTVTGLSERSSHASKRQRTANHTPRFSNKLTLFLCNLSKDTTKQDIEALFHEIPSLKEVRLIVKERGHHMKSRGMAYVEFHDESGVNRGLAFNGTVLHGSAINVTVSAPPPSSSGPISEGTCSHKTMASPSIEPTISTVFVGGLTSGKAEHISEDQVHDAVVKVVGIQPEQIKRILNLNDRRGNPKDYALIEFSDSTILQICLKREAELKKELQADITLQVSKLTIDQVVRHRDEQKAKVAAARANNTVTKSVKPKKGIHKPVLAAPHSKPNTRLNVVVSKTGRSHPHQLVPRVLRRPLPNDATATPQVVGPPADVGIDQSALEKGTTSVSVATPTAPTPSKSNDDFRKLFLQSTSG